ncbi:MAG TPA: hypothetical protein VKA70_02255 [Blastocatellia bacterium]|nr:hypothetical protein [Blastocatellia bacterium]
MLTSRQSQSFAPKFNIGICLRALFMLAAIFIWPGVSLGQDQRCNPAVSRGIIDVGGYFTAPDNFQHAIVSNDGSLYEIYFDPAKGIFQSNLARFPDTIAIAAEFAPRDVQRQNVIIARRNGEIHHAWFVPSFRIESRLLTRINGVVDVAAFYSDDTGIQRAVVATATGDIIELEWFSGLTPEPSPLFRVTTLTNIPGAARLAGFFTRDDRYNIVLVSTSSGDVYEIFYKDPASIGRSLIASYSNIVDVGGFYTDDDQFRHAIIGTGDGTIHEVFYHPTKGKGATPLTNVPGLKRLAGYATTPVNGWRHVIVGTSAGEVQELFYDPKVGKGIGLLRSYAPEATFGEDPSPNLANSVDQTIRASTAGLTLAVDGDNNLLYAISLNAGVWRSAEGGAWQQLTASPPRACSIAVEPNRATHLVVGEREGDSISTSLNRSGIWESFDSGNSWSYVLDPRTIKGCNAQAIPSLTFDTLGNIYAATDCGVVKKPAGGTAFQLLRGTEARGSFTVVTTVDVAGSTWVWARTRDSFFLSRDAGATWEQIAIPAVVAGESISRGSRGDYFSLAAFDTSAFTICSTDKGSAVITFEANTKTWSLEQIKDGDGTGLGGRRFVKSYFLNNPPQFRWVLFAGTGQGAFMKVLGFAPSWYRVAETPWPLGPGDKHEFNPVSKIHVDIWDLHMSTPRASRVWLGTDGGVYRTDLSRILGALSTPGLSAQYFHQSEGMHTHHVHTISLITEGMTRRSKTLYTTADNDEWLRNSSSILYPLAAWQTWGQQGDSNWTAADNGSSPIALIMRNPSLLHLTGFGDTVPPEATKYAQTPRAFKISTGAFFRGQEFFNFIQTTKSEPSNSLIDIVMLAKLPLASPDPMGKTVLIRNRKFAANPNADESKLSTPDWVIVDERLPNGAQRVWASGGHTDPVYYVYAEDSAGISGKLFRRQGAALPWQDITPTDPLIPYSGFGTALFGPAFINPYDRNHLLVATVAGIKVSRDGGNSYQDDPVITALITGSGKYPLTGDYRGGNGQNVVHFSQAAQMATLSQVTFYRDDPRKLVVAAPYTGVFYLDESCGYWQDLTPYLPTPLPAAPSVAIDHEAVYAALEGRSIYQIRAYEFAPRATYFSRGGLTGRQVARLLRASGAPLTGTNVTLTCAKLDGAVLFQGSTATDGSGVIGLPPVVTAPGAYVIHIDYTGAMPVLARSTTSFIFTL